MPKIITRTLITLLLFSISSLSLADTYDPLDFERPSSWYLSGIAGTNFLKGSQLIHPLIPVAFNLNGVPSDSYQPGYELGYHFGTALGFHLTQNYRADVEYRFANNASRKFSDVIKTNLGDTYPSTGDGLEIMTHTLIANLYYDFYPYNLPVYPYVGLGFGAAFTKATAFNVEIAPSPPSSTILNPSNTLTSASVGESGFDTKFAIQASLGFQKVIHDTFWVDFYYRYLNVNVPKFYNHRMQNHLFGMALMFYLPEGKRGHFTPEYDNVMGFERVWYIKAHTGGNYVANNDYAYQQIIARGPQLPGLTLDKTVMANGDVGVSHKLGYNLGGAIGFYMNDYVRLEFEYNHSNSRAAKVSGITPAPDDGLSPAGPFTGTNKLSNNSYMFNGYYDFINVGRKYKPYAGIGLGVARSRYTDIIGYVQRPDTSLVFGTLPAQNATRFAMQFMTGFRNKRSSRWTLEYGYRYFVIPRPSIQTHAHQNHIFNVSLEYILTPTQGDDI